MRTCKPSMFQFVAQSGAAYNITTGRDNNGEMRRSNRRPLLGLTVTPSKLCYLGMEEEGLQIVTIDPGGPAEKAGLQAGVASGATRRLTELAASGDLGGIDEVTSPDDNLQAVFQYLVK